MSLPVARFAVLDAPHCVWAPDLRDRNIQFLRSIDPRYYAYVVRANEDRLDDPTDRHYAAAALRLAFYQGVENLFAMLGAAVQAPHCVYGWLLKYSIRDLREVTRRIDSGDPLLTLLPGDPLSWESISTVVHCLDGAPPEFCGAVQRGFAQAWTRLAEEFLTREHQEEYNSLKHGARARLGGFSLTMRSETHFGATGTSRPGIHIPGSEFGSRFPILVGIGQDRRNSTVGTCARNWGPRFLLDALCLIADSLNNIISYLLVQNGLPGSECKLRYPDNLTVFEDMWTPEYQVIGQRMTPRFDATNARVLTRDEILAVYATPANQQRPQ